MISGSEPLTDQNIDGGFDVCYAFDAQRLTGLAYSTINEMCNNRTRRIDFDTIDVLCSALGCSVEDIIEYVADPRRSSSSTRKR